MTQVIKNQKIVVIEGNEAVGKDIVCLLYTSRGVNSQFIIRNLLIRGLIDRVENPGDARIFLYKPTLALLSHLGVSKVKDLPEYDQVRKEIENFKKTEGSSQN